MNDVTIAEAARVLSLNESSIRRRIRRGQMRARRVGGRLWLIPAEELERWRTRGRLRPGPVRQKLDCQESRAVDEVHEMPQPGDCRPRDESPRRGTAAALLKYVGTWEGDDLEERLTEVYATRSRARF